MNRPLWIWFAVPLILSLPVTSHPATKLGTIWDDTVIVNSACSGVKTFSGDDTVTNNSTVNASQSVTLNPAATVSKTAVDSGSGDDKIVNNGTLNAEAAATASEAACASATAADAGADNDTLVNRQTVTAHARAVVPRRGNSLWDQLLASIMGGTLDLVHKATADAQGMTGGLGSDSLTSLGPVAVTADALVLEPAMAASSAAHALGLSSETVTSTGPVDVTSHAAVVYSGLTGTGTGIYGAQSMATATGIEAQGGQAQVIATGDLTIAADAAVSLDETATLSPLLSAALIGALSSSESTGIQTGGGDDTLDVDATLNVTAGASVTAHTLAASGLGATALPIPVSSARATGLGTGMGHDALSLTGSITTAASAQNSSSGVAAVVTGITVAETASLATSHARAVDTGHGDDTVSSGANLSARSRAAATYANLSLSGIGIDAAITGGVLATSEATALDAGAGDDAVTSTGGLHATAEASATSLEFALQGAGFAQLNASSASRASATGLDLGTGTDTLSSGGTATADATATSLGIRVDLTGIGGSVAGGTLLDSGTSAVARATTLTASAGPTTIENNGALTATTHASATSASVSATALGAALSTESIVYNGTQATGESAGIATCLGDDRVTNTATIDAAARAQTASVEISATLIGMTASTASSEATATASAIETDGGCDTIANSGTLSAVSRADALGAKADLVGIGAAAATGSLFHGATKAEAAATGINAGLDNDTLANSGAITGSAEAETFSAEITGSLAGISLAADSLFVGGSKANASATAIDAGWGDDAVTNDALLAMHASSRATSVKLSAVGLGAALTADSIFDTGTSAGSEAQGIATGLGDDTVANRGDIAVAAGAATLSVEGSLALIGVAASTASSEANATASAITTDGGADTITNTGALSATATSSATGVKATLAGIGGAAAVDSLFNGGTTAHAEATGIDSGPGGDTVINRGVVTAATHASALTAKIAATGLGIALTGDSLFESGTVAEAISTGIATGMGEDQIRNENHVTANAFAETTSIEATAALVGVAVTSATSRADASSTGIDAGMCDDTMLNLSEISHAATATTHGIKIALTGLGVAGSTDSLFNGGAKALAQTTGLFGGEGADTLETLGDLSGTAHATATAVTLDFAAIGAALAANNTTEAHAEATGLSGGFGDDALTNRATVSQHAEAATTAVSLNLAAIGVALGLDNTAEALSRTTGISGGWGNDTLSSFGLIHNSATARATAADVALSLLGAGITDASTTARAQSVGMAGEQGCDTLANNHEISLNAQATASTGSAAITLAGMAASTASTRSEAETTGLSGGDEMDTLINNAALSATSTAATDATGVTVTLAGYGDAQADSGAHASAVGMDGGACHDGLLNNGAITATALSAATSGSVSIALAGAATGDAGTLALAEATGITGGSGCDAIENAGALAALASAHADGTAGAVTLAGFGAAQADATGKALATGILGGGDGDEILNSGSLLAHATARADAGSVSVTLAGAAEGHAHAVADAESAGLNGGNGDDTLVNTGNLLATAASVANATQCQVTLAGAGTAGANTEANSSATGFDGGDGDDRMENRASAAVRATSGLTLAGFGFTLAGTTSQDGALRAEALSHGVDGGEGDDLFINNGSLEVASNAALHAASSSNTAAGVASGRLETEASAQAWGLYGGTGDDRLANNALLFVSGDATTTADGSSFSFAGSASQSGKLTAESRVTGFDGDTGSDALVNSGTARVHATAALDIRGDSSVAFGVAAGKALSDAETRAIGFSGGDGVDHLENTGLLSVISRATTFSDRSSFSMAGTTSSGAVLTSVADAVGFESGAGNDTLFNSGEVTVNATSTITSTGGANVVFGGTANASATVGTQTSVTGIDAGEGNATIVNNATGRLTLHALGDGNATNSSDGGWFFSDAGTASSIAYALTGHGVRLGNGENTLINAGHIGLSLNTAGRAFADSNGGGIINADARASAQAMAAADAYGVLGGDGNNRIDNSGSLIVSASPVAQAHAIADGDGVDGDGTATAMASTRVSCWGVKLGEGDNTLFNSGTIHVAALSGTIARADADGDLGGSAIEHSDQIPSAGAWGIQMGGGDNTLTNSGQLTVGNAPTLSYSAGTNTLLTLNRVRASQLEDAALALGTPNTYDAPVTVKTWGLSAGDGANVIENRGTLSISATPTVNTAAESNLHVAVTLPDDVDGDGEEDTAAEIQTYLSLVRAAVTGSSLTSGATVSSRAWGIQAGHGGNRIQNSGTLTVSVLPSVANAATGTLTYSVNGSTASWESTAPQTISAVNGWACGIETGSGDDTVLNSGTLAVSANAFPDDSAVGILTAGGNDTVLNLGLIRTSEYGGAEGRAIDTGSGDDAVVLGAGSETYGDIILGSGDDALTFIGDARVGSLIDGGDDSDTLHFVGTGGNTLHFASFESCEKGGDGIYTLSSLPSVTRTRLLRGTLAIGSHVTLSPGHTLSALVYGGGGHGALAVTGTAALGGNLAVGNGGGAFSDGTLYPILTATALTGGFHQTTLPEPTPLLGFSLHREPQALQVRSDVNAFESVAQTPSQMAVAKSMDAALPTADGELAQALGAFQALPASAFPTAFDGLTPDLYTHLTLTTLSQGDLHLEALMAHLKEEKTGYWAELPAARAATESALRPEYGEMHIDSVVVGRSLALTPNLTAGFSLNTGTTTGASGTARTDLSESTISEWAGYGHMGLGQGYIDMALLVGHYRSDAQRTIAFPGYHASTRASYDSQRISTLVSGGYRFEAEGWSWGPTVQVAHCALLEEGFTETGGGTLGLTVDKRQLDFFVTRLGVEMLRTVPTPAGILTTNASAAWDRTYGLNDLQLQARYDGSPQETLDLNLGDVKPYGMQLAAGVSLLTPCGTTLSLKGTGRIGSQSSTGTLSTECAIPF